eukprot:m.4758 g.4758  ORF g.4758 m.4758 type:complete len:440 (-) comp4388_c0_seq2:26-1345(-)
MEESKKRAGEPLHAERKVSREFPEENKEEVSDESGPQASKQTETVTGEGGEQQHKEKDQQSTAQAESEAQDSFLQDYHYDPVSGWYISNTNPSWQYNAQDGIFYDSITASFYRLDADGHYTPCVYEFRVAEPPPPEVDPILAATCVTVNGDLESMQGKRPTQEDRHVHIDRVAGSHCTLPMHASVYAVYDGHLGAGCSEFLEKHLHVAVLDAMLPLPAYNVHTIRECITEAFAKTDTEFLRIARIRKHRDGSCCVFALILGRALFVAHVGDSRAVLSNAGKAHRLTEDHKPGRPDERARIEAAGGFVTQAVKGIFRVCAFSPQELATRAAAPRPPPPALQLAVSRSFGDLELKQPVALVTSTPEIHVHTLDVKDEFLVMACDGVWDVLGDQEVVDIAGPLARAGDLKAAAHAVVKEAFARGSTDNISVIVVTLSVKEQT